MSFRLSFATGGVRVAANERASTARQRERGQRCCVCATWLGGAAWADLGRRYCPKCEPRPHRVLMNFVSCGGYTVHFVAEDCRTPLSRFYKVGLPEAVRELVLRTLPNEETLANFDRMMRSWGHGSIFLQLTEAQYRAICTRR